ncbi:MAG: dihydrofolate reductase family protein [Nitrososphaeraceae archaeon]
MSFIISQRETDNYEWKDRCKYEKISVFIHISLDGFFAGSNDEIDWFKIIKKDPEWEKHTYRESHPGSTLLFGATTYKMMKSYWLTDAAIQSDPHMTKVMNESPKIVISKTLNGVKDEGNWKNVTIIRDLNHDTITKLKEGEWGWYWSRNHIGKQEHYITACQHGFN